MEPLEFDEDIQPLTATGSSATTSRRHLNVNGRSSSIKGPITTLLMFVSIGAVYIMGKEKGQSLRFNSPTNHVNMTTPVKMFVPKTAPVVKNASLAKELVITEGTDTDTDPPVPTYDPTRIESTPTGRLKLLYAVHVFTQKQLLLKNCLVPGAWDLQWQSCLCTWHNDWYLNCSNVICWLCCLSIITHIYWLLCCI